MSGRVFGEHITCTLTNASSLFFCCCSSLSLSFFLSLSHSLSLPPKPVMVFCRRIFGFRVCYHWRKTLAGLRPLGCKIFKILRFISLANGLGFIKGRSARAHHPSSLPLAFAPNNPPHGPLEYTFIQGWGVPAEKPHGRCLGKCTPVHGVAEFFRPPLASTSFFFCTLPIARQKPQKKALGSKSFFAALLPVEVVQIKKHIAAPGCPLPKMTPPGVDSDIIFGKNRPLVEKSLGLRVCNFVGGF